MNDNRPKGRCGCEILVGTIRGDHGSFPLSPSGWAQALKLATEKSKNDSLVLVDLKCNDGRMAIYQCSNERCGIEAPDPQVLVHSGGGPGNMRFAVMPKQGPIAGARRRRRTPR